MEEVSSKASPLYPHHCYRVVTLNVSEVQFGESNSSRRACVLLFFFCACGVQEEGMAGAGVDDGHTSKTDWRLIAMIEPPKWSILTH